MNGSRGYLPVPINPRYTCVCGKCHVKTGAIWVGVVEVFFYGLILSTNLFNAYSPTGHTSVANVGGTLLGFALLVSLMLLLFIGLSTRSPKLVILHTFFQVFLILFLLIAVIILTVGMAKDWGPVQTFFLDLQTYYKSSLSIKGGVFQDDFVFELPIKITGVLVVAALSLLILLQAWFLTVMLRCYQFFNDQDTYGVCFSPPIDRESVGSAIQYNITPATSKRKLHSVEVPEFHSTVL